MTEFKKQIEDILVNHFPNTESVKLTMKDGYVVELSVELPKYERDKLNVYQERDSSES